MSTRLLCVGDIHLGRRPSRLPDDLFQWGRQSGDLTPAAAWRRVVEVAIEREVHGVVLAGDLVESDNRFFEAYGPLYSGVKQLLDKGISVVGVAGNHDVEVLPRLADELPGFTLLGRGGRWETHVIDPKGAQAVRLLGWSYPQKIVRTSPFDTLMSVPDDLPLVGVLHGDLDRHGSGYAPFSAAALRAAPGDAWLLGHIHVPSSHLQAVPRGYLGCLSALDPGEAGERGAWLLDVAGRGALTMERLRLAPLRWETAPVNVSGLAEPDDIEGAIVQALHALHARIGDSIGETNVVGCRVRLVGDTKTHRSIVASLSKKDPRATRVTIDRCLYFVDSVADEAREPLDLEALSRGTDPPGLLARMLMEVERNTDAGQRLVATATTELQKTALQSAWAAIDAIPNLEDQARHHLLTAGRRALEDLLVQRETT